MKSARTLKQQDPSLQRLASLPVISNPDGLCWGFWDFAGPCGSWLESVLLVPLTMWSCCFCKKCQELEHVQVAWGSAPGS